MEKNPRFTNESLTKKFKNNFELVNYAIQLAENMIRSGRETRVKSDMQNRAMLILEEILEGKDQFDEIQPHAESSTRQGQAREDQALQQAFIFEEKVEKRRSRSFDEEE